MKFLSLEPMVPSGSNCEGSKKLFTELRFNVNWDAGDYVGFKKTVANLFHKNTSRRILPQI